MIDFIFFVTIFLLCGVLTIAFYSSFVNKGNVVWRNVFIQGLIFRIILTYVYYYYTVLRPSDAAKYFRYARDVGFKPEGLLHSGTEFVNNLCALLYPFSSFFENRYLMMYIPFSVAAFLGSLFMYDILKTLLNQKQHVRMINFCAFFLPNLVFWTSNLGKDSLCFLGIMIMMRAVLISKTIRNQIPLLIVGGAILYMVRPHVLLFMLAGFGFGYFLRGGKFSIQSSIIFVLSIFAFVILFSPVMSFVGINIEKDPELGQGGFNISEYYDAGMEAIESKSGNLATGGAAMAGAGRVNPVLAPLYFIQFIGGPFLWQARNGIQLFSALENIVYQFMLFYIIRNWLLFNSKVTLQQKYSWIIFIIIASTLMGMAYSNFGLTVRQKCMILPALIIVFASVWGAKHVKKTSDTGRVAPKPRIRYNY